MYGYERNPAKSGQTGDPTALKNFRLSGNVLVCYPDADQNPDEIRIRYQIMGATGPKERAFSIFNRFQKAN